MGLAPFQPEFVFPELRQPEHTVDDTAPCIAEVRNHCSCTVTPTGVHSGMCFRWEKASCFILFHYRHLLLAFIYENGQTDT